jgi:predicted Zn-ribbon and HTH transcriptional regulator
VSQQELVAAKTEIRRQLQEIRRRENLQRLELLTELSRRFFKEFEVVQARCAETGHKWQETSIPFRVYSPVQEICTWCDIERPDEEVDAAQADS